jgi:hypothetical protein
VDGLMNFPSSKKYNNYWMMRFVDDITSLRNTPRQSTLAKLWNTLCKWQDFRKLFPQWRQRCTGILKLELPAVVTFEMH